MIVENADDESLQIEQESILQRIWEEDSGNERKEKDDDDDDDEDIYLR